VGLQAEVFLDRCEALEEVIDFFGKAGCIAGSFVERLQTLPDITQLGLDVSDAGFKRIEAGVETAFKLLKIVLGSGFVFREHAVFDEINCRENALNIFVHTVSVYHRGLGTSKNGSRDRRLWETVLPVAPVGHGNWKPGRSRILEGGRMHRLGPARRWWVRTEADATG
jgi:predicted small secreted protein